MARLDLHCHTGASYDSKLDPVRLVELAREQGLTHVAITDHETMAGALAAQARNAEGIEVIVGEEVRTLDGDLILLYVKEPIPGGMSVQDTVDAAREQGCLVGLAHPFDVYRPSIGRGLERPDDLAALAALVDFVEIHNGRVTDDRANARAAEFARAYGLAQVASSDCHTAAEVGACYVELAGPARDPETLRNALAQASLHVRHAERSENEGLARRLRGLAGGWRGR